MASPPSLALVLCLAALGAGALTLADPSPPVAQANVACDVGLAPADAVTGAIGIGDPMGDACEAVTDPVLDLAGDAIVDPLKDAAASIGEGVFNRITAWVAEGAVWLISEVAVMSEKTTTPNLLSKGFLKQYRSMALLAAFMAALMLIFAVFEALGRGDPGMLWRVFLVNAPLAAIATSAAYVVVQLLVATCDGMSEAIWQSSGADAERFLKGTVKAVIAVGGGAGAAAGGAVAGPGGAAGGAVAVPMFVGLIAIAVAAFAAFFVWLELLMRDAAIYVVALFMPLAIAASIWPRWVSALRRTCELVVVIVFSKFVIVAIISLAASLIAHNEGSVEHVLAGAAMLLLACFSPFVLFKLVPFAEGALSSAYGRQSASGGVARTMNSAQMVRTLSRANWAASSKAGAAGGGSGGGSAQGIGGAKGGGGGGQGAAAAGGGGAAAGGAGAVALESTVGAAKRTKAAAERLAATGTAQAASAEGADRFGAPAGGGTEGAGSPPRPKAAGSESPPRAGASPANEGGGSPAKPSDMAAAEPSEAHGGKAPGAGARAPRPATDKGSPGAGGRGPA